jgi:hypothetical protein
MLNFSKGIQKKSIKTLKYLIFIYFYFIAISVFANSTNLTYHNSDCQFEANCISDSIDYVSKFIKRGYTKKEIISIAKGKRPMPSNYLKRKYIRRHIRTFKRGASLLIPEDILEKFGREFIGRTDGQFVMNKKEMNELIIKANGNLSYLETELGIPSGLWKNSRIIRIDIPSPRRLHIRLPSGNEAGTNELWIPGGKLPNGYSESVIDRIPKGKYIETQILLK